MATFILIHGAVHGGWCWDRLIPHLEARGHHVLAPDLPAMGDDRSIALPEVTLAHWGDFVAGLVGRADGDVILVGHSRGGIVIGEAAERVPDRVRGLVYLSALITPPSSSAAEVNARVGGPVASVAEGATSFSFDPAMTVPFFYNRCDPADAAMAAGRLCPEPIAPLLEPASVTWERWGRVPRAFIECLHDAALTLDVQRAIQAGALCDPVIALPTDHSPFLCAPDSLADALDRCAAAFSNR